MTTPNRSPLVYVELSTARHDETRDERWFRHLGVLFRVDLYAIRRRIVRAFEADRQRYHRG